MPQQVAKGRTVGEVEVVLSGAVTALSSAVVYLFFDLRSRFKDVDQALKDCNKDRELLWKKIVALSRGESIDFSDDRKATTEGR
jgi:hypothetical protein